MPCIVDRVIGRRVWDSRGRPTVEVELHSATGQMGRSSAPAGASRGSNEAVDLRDGGLQFGGWGVDKAVANVNGPIRMALIGMDATDQSSIDQVLIELDGTSNKSRLGGNATIATSMAALHLAAASQGLPLWRYLAHGAQVRLPLPEIQIFGGGVHAGKRLDIQDLMVMPIGARSFDDALVMAATVYRVAGETMAEMGRVAGVADEGGWWPLFDSNEEALEILSRSIDRAGYGNGQVGISLDIAASQLGSGGQYRTNLDQRVYKRDEWLEMLLGWIRRYPILSLEDPFGEDDLAGMQSITAAVGDRVQVIGDDFLVTNAERVINAAQQNACNAVLLKPNQAGTITEMRNTLKAAQNAGFGTIASARSGETEDVTIVHLAVGWNIGQLKVGAFARSERVAKWNEGLRIEEELGADSIFAAHAALPTKTSSPR